MHFRVMYTMPNFPDGPVYGRLHPSAPTANAAKPKSLIYKEGCRSLRLALKLLIRGCPGPGWEFTVRRIRMNTLYLKFLVKMQDLMNREDGQDLVEYALLVALISTAVVAGAQGVASAINKQFSTIAATIS